MAGCPGRDVKWRCRAGLKMVSELIWKWKTSLYRLFRHHVPPFSTIHRGETRALQKWLSFSSPTGLWLDVGCGRGILFQVTAWEGNRIGVDRVKTLLPKRGDRKGTNWLCARAEALPLRDGCVDLLTAVGLVEYVRNRRAFWWEMFGVLRPRARAVVTAARPGLLNFLRWFLGHRVRTVPREVMQEELQEAGFRLLDFHATLLQWQFLLEKPE